MNSLENLRNRLESLLSGLLEVTPRTGTLGAETITPSQRTEPEGFVFETDLNGNFVWCSPEVERILGRSPDELEGTSIFDIASSLSKVDEFKERIESGQPIYNFRVQASNPAGKLLTLLFNALVRADPAGVLLGYRGVAQAIFFEEPLPVREGAEADEVQLATLKYLSPGIFWGETAGYLADEMGARPLSLPHDGIALDEEPDENVLRVPISDQERVLGVIELEKPFDTENWDTEEIDVAEGVANDLALALQSARTYQLTQQALDEMREVDRLKSQFLANMSHELRTPLNSIIGFSRVILKGIDGPVTETQEQDLNAIYNAGQHLLGLINDMLDVSRIEAGKMELTFSEVDVREIIRGVLATAVGLVKDKSIEIRSDLPDEIPLVWADNIRVRQILLNLFSNAAKFTTEGEIEIAVRVVEDEDPNKLLISVSDTGQGIAEADQEKLFEPFSQVDASPTRKTGGTGLGLSICRHLVELHGGEIWVESTPGEGSVFYFSLPIKPTAPTMPSTDTGAE
jgi:PAS domain S-box-containing protein